jgi:hypothetical protein
LPLQRPQFLFRGGILLYLIPVGLPKPLLIEGEAGRRIALRLLGQAAVGGQG